MKPLAGLRLFTKAPDNPPNVKVESECYYFLFSVSKTEYGVHAVGYEPLMRADARLKKYQRGSLTLSRHLWKLAEKLMCFYDWSNYSQVHFEIVKYDDLPDWVKDRLKEIGNDKR